MSKKPKPECVHEFVPFRSDCTKCGYPYAEQAPAQDEREAEAAVKALLFNGRLVDSFLIRDICKAVLSSAPIAQTAPQPSEESLVQNAKALLALDERGALAPHGIGGLAREVIEKLIAHIERTTPQPEQSALSGKCWIEVIGGREGPSIYIGDGEIAHRLAGNKPWGGGRTLHSFKVDVAELVREASALAIQGSSKP